MEPKRRRIYLAGPMTGLPDFNFPAFHAAAARLREAGWEVINPAENFGGRTDLPRETYIRADVILLAQCDAVALLPGWEESRGARLEYLLARELSMTAIDTETLEPLKNPPVTNIGLHQLVLVREVEAETVLDEAARLTSSERQGDYGDPSDDFYRTALMWTAILDGKLREDAEVEAADVPLCMIAVKLARQSHSHKRDNLVDIAGYARTAAMVAGEE